MRFSLGHSVAQFNRLLLQRRTQSDFELHRSRETIALSSGIQRVEQHRRLSLGYWKDGENEKTHLHTYVCVLVDCRWEEREISRFTSLFKLRIQVPYDLLWGESLGWFCGSHDNFPESSWVSRWRLTGVRRTGLHNLEIGGGASKAKHQTKVTCRSLTLSPRRLAFGGCVCTGSR